MHILLNNFKFVYQVRKFGGSIKQFTEALVGVGVKNPPTAAALQKACKRADDPTPKSDWVACTHIAINLCEQFIRGKKLNGYVQRFDVSYSLF